MEELADHIRHIVDPESFGDHQYIQALVKGHLEKIRPEDVHVDRAPDMDLVHLEIQLAAQISRSRLRTPEEHWAAEMYFLNLVVAVQIARFRSQSQEFGHDRLENQFATRSRS